MKKRLKIAILALAFVLVLASGTFLIYASDYYRADPAAQAIGQSSAVTQLQDGLIVLEGDSSDKTALIFYPGAKVEYIAYLPILEKIRQTSGITCILVKMPFNMAIFDADAAAGVIKQFPEMENWYVGGHSMGGAMASDFASKNPDKVEGLILLGAYLYGDYPAEKALTVYGSFNTSVAEKVDYSENVVVLEGGNHAQFGNYGKQKGDVDATITGEEQQDMAAGAIARFLAR